MPAIVTPIQRNREQAQKPVKRNANFTLLQRAEIIDYGSKNPDSTLNTIAVWAMKKWNLAAEPSKSCISKLLHAQDNTPITSSIVGSQ
jgi:hypothetical protein